jgi:hypothetical protein
MCRSSDETADGKPLRCERCNDPKKRRDRQNLANAVKREIAIESEEAPETHEPVRESEELTSFVADEVQELRLPAEDEALVAETVQELLSDPEVTKELAASVREARETAENPRAWMLGGREDTPKNLAAGLAERQQEILLVGAAVAERAKEIHGVDLEEARKDWQARIPLAKEELDAMTVDAHAAQDEFIAYRQELIKKYESPIYEFEEKISPEEAEELERLRLEKNAKMDAKEEAGENFRQMLRGHDKVTAEVLDRIAEGNRQAIAEVRSVGTVPVSFEEKIRGGDAGQVFTEAVSTVFPDDWVKKSNEKGPLSLIRTSDREGRVHYSPAGQNISPYTYILPYQPDERDSRFEGWRPQVNEEGNPTGKWEGMKRDVLMMEPDPRTYKKYNKDGTPKGTGWKKGQAVQKDGSLVPIWVRDNATDAKSVASRGDTGGKISVNMNGKKRDVTQDFQHEFSHRIEDSNPHIVTLEQAFVASRTTDASGRRDPLVRYEENPREQIRPDNFVKPYIGKEYETEPMCEVLSMGTESVFGGNHGGLVGIGEERSDPEMRNWILGVYATA